MVQLLGYLPGVRAPDLPDVGNALNRLGEGVEYYRNEAKTARAYQDAQEQKRYARGRASGGDNDARMKAFGQAALKLSAMPDDDPMKGKVWESLLKRSGSSDLTPEQMDFRTGPKLMAAEAGLFNDPYEQEERKLKLDKLRREASGQTAAPEQPMNVREWEYFNKLPPEQQSQYLNMKRSIPYLNQETQFVKPDPVTGQPMATVPIDNAGKARDTVVGRETGEGQMQLPKSEAGLKTYELQDDAVNAAIDKASAMATDGFGTTGFVGSVARNVPGTPAYNLAQQLKTIKGNIGFDKLQSLRDNSPTGGALGQVAVQELEMLQSVLGSVEQAQTKEEFLAGLVTVKRLRGEFRKLKREAYQRDVARFGAQRVPNPDSQGTGGASAPASDYSSMSDEELLQQLGGR